MSIFCFFLYLLFKVSLRSRSVVCDHKGRSYRWLMTVLHRPMKVKVVVSVQVVKALGGIGEGHGGVVDLVEIPLLHERVKAGPEDHTDWLKKKEIIQGTQHIPISPENMVVREAEVYVQRPMRREISIGNYSSPKDNTPG